MWTFSLKESFALGSPKGLFVLFLTKIDSLTNLAATFFAPSAGSELSANGLAEDFRQKHDLEKTKTKLSLSRQIQKRLSMQTLYGPIILRNRAE